jgi:hypothetical protein
MITENHPVRDPSRILLDLAKSSGDHGPWFAAAKGCRVSRSGAIFCEDRFAEPRTLSRASRDLLEKDHQFSLQVGTSRFNECSTAMDTT